MSRAGPGPLIGFFALAYALMWACFFTVAAVPIPARSPLGSGLLLLGAFAPSLSALAMTARFEGSSGVRSLLDRVFDWHVPARWYLFAAGYMAAIKLLAALVHRAVFAAWPQFGTTSIFLMPFAVAVSIPFQAGEEIGWRGYALPRLTARLGLQMASLVLGLIWALWHLPQFYIHGADSYRQSFLVFTLQVTALSVAMAWLFVRTGGRLLPVMVMHAAINNTKDIVPSGAVAGSALLGLHASPVGWLTLALLWVCAGWFLAHMGRFASTPRDNELATPPLPNAQMQGIRPPR